MVTIVAIVSVILIIITTLTSAVISSVLDMQLSEDVRSAAARLPRDVTQSLVNGDSAAGALAERPVERGLLLVAETADGLTGAVVGPASVTELTGDQLDDVVHTMSGDPHSETVTISDLGTYRIQTAAIQSTGQIIVIGLPTAEVQATIGRLWRTIMLATIGGMVLLGIATTLVIRAGLRPLRAVAETATRVAQQPLDQGAVSIDERVPEAEADPRNEIGQVGAALNTLLDHVESSLHARQRNEELMRRFVADASHELRTPLASIRGYSELSLRDPSLSDNTEQALERIQAQSIRMTSLVEDLLLLARLDEGQEIVLGAVDLTQLAVEALADQQAAGPDHAWSVDVPEEPVVIAGDRGRLTQVIANLLANARTHTPEGTRVELGLRLEGEGGATRAVLTVHDDGPGIDADLQRELFTRFARGDRSRARRTGGTGLGLSIAKAIVEAHHGEISVRSVPGDTTFEVRLPARPAS
ncbi:sensor histidine kinase [Microbacterium oryzae]|uniref:histidine kinase n=2 Tax=Microbacterium oryzae TaxID=743009 RepID=A0A6I6EAT9_9MICO|nr:HAMP domain-containing sensor histidine kinase [Microbacterium oryzae]QGU28711.1 sensor histidine kinase [Microbacterium oryzae]